MVTDFRELRNFQKKLEVAEQEIEKIMVETVKDVAEEFLKEVIRRTPKSDTDLLKRSWKCDMNVKKEGNTYTVEIVNESEIASFIEYGHKTANGGWVEGKFMMTITEDEVKRKLPAIAQKRIDEYLKGVFK